MDADESAFLGTGMQLGPEDEEEEPRVAGGPSDQVLEGAKLDMGSAGASMVEARVASPVEDEGGGEGGAIEATGEAVAREGEGTLEEGPPEAAQAPAATPDGVSFPVPPPEAAQDCDPSLAMSLRVGADVGGTPRPWVPVAPHGRYRGLRPQRAVDLMEMTDFADGTGPATGGAETGAPRSRSRSRSASPARRARAPRPRSAVQAAEDSDGDGHEKHPREDEPVPVAPRDPHGRQPVSERAFPCRSPCALTCISAAGVSSTALQPRFHLPETVLGNLRCWFPSSLQRDSLTAPSSLPPQTYPTLASNPPLPAASRSPRPRTHLSSEFPGPRGSKYDQFPPGKARGTRAKPALLRGCAMLLAVEAAMRDKGMYFVGAGARYRWTRPPRHG